MAPTPPGLSESFKDMCAVAPVHTQPATKPAPLVQSATNHGEAGEPQLSRRFTAQGLLQETYVAKVCAADEVSKLPRVPDRIIHSAALHSTNCIIAAKQSALLTTMRNFWADYVPIDHMPNGARVRPQTDPYSMLHAQAPSFPPHASSRAYKRARTTRPRS